MAISLTKRACKLAGKLKPYGTAEQGACDFTLGAIMLDAEELNALFEDSSMHDRLFARPSMELHEPFTRRLDFPLAFNVEYEKARVNLRLGPNLDELILPGCALSKITLEPKTGGLTEMSLLVHSTPDKDQLATLYVHMDDAAQVSIKFGREQAKKKPQPELPLEHQSQGEEVATEDEAA